MFDNLKEMVSESVSKYASKNAFLQKKDGKYVGITYAQLEKDMNSLGTALLDIGLEDKKIAIIGENRYGWCVSYLAIMNGAGIAVPLDKELTEHEIINLLNRAKVSALVYSGKFEAVAQKALKEVESLEILIGMDVVESKENKYSLVELFKKGEEIIKNGDRRYEGIELDNRAMKVILFTSGTTGNAKGVMLCHDNICSMIKSVSHMVDICSTDTSLSVLPLHHTFECTCGFLYLISKGATIAFSEGLKQIASNLNEIKPTIMIVVPLIIEKMHRKIQSKVKQKVTTKIVFNIMLASAGFLKKIGIDVRRKLFKKVLDQFGGNLRLFITGASAMNPKISKNIYNMGIAVVQGYGLTESSPILIGNTIKKFKHAAIGMAIKDVEIRIDNPDKNGLGEIVGKGRNVMLGYYENQEETDKVLKDGWLYTGDIGYKDKDGFYYITGRKKNIIVTKNGKNVYPEEIEQEINKSDFISESLIVSKHDDIETENYIKVVVVPDIDAISLSLGKKLATEDEIKVVIKEEIGKTNKLMPIYKRIKDFEIRYDEFKKTTTKKIKRFINN